MLYYTLCISCKHFCSIFFLRQRARWLLVAIVSLLYIFIFVLYVLSILDYMFDIEKKIIDLPKRVHFSTQICISFIVNWNHYCRLLLWLNSLVSFTQLNSNIKRYVLYLARGPKYCSHSCYACALCLPVSFRFKEIKQYF